MADKLERYRSMRDFERTPEPSETTVPARDELRFVVQEHHATALHWDFRLERDGVLVSWAVPKGVPAHPKQNNLAVHTEDHPMAYLDFEGTIPEGEYGGGRVDVWDHGSYVIEKWTDREVIVVLSGRRVRGRYALFQTGGNQWMIHRMDPPEDPDRQLMPEDLAPAPMSSGTLPSEEAAWAFEPWLGGRRVMMASAGGRTSALDDSGTDITDRLPELREVGRALGTVEVALEAELIIAGDDGRPDERALKHRLDTAKGAALRRMAQRSPATLLAADLAWLEGHSTAALPFRDRRSLLERLQVDGAGWQVKPSHAGEGTTLVAAAAAQGLAGVVARRLDGPYDEGSLLLVPVYQRSR